MVTTSTMPRQLRGPKHVPRQLDMLPLTEEIAAAVRTFLSRQSNAEALAQGLMAPLVGDAASLCASFDKQLADNGL